jgi:DNA-binding transcriptional regulator WhiA
MSLMLLHRSLNPDKFLQSYIIGVALGDGNLSNPNGRAVRLRVTCDKKYPKLIVHIKSSLKALLPENKVGLVNKTGCIDISVYSNQLPELIGYPWNGGPKIVQDVGVPIWIKSNVQYYKECLRGLFQTDGCIYNDRGYVMVNFTSAGKRLADDVLLMMNKLEYHPHVQKIYQNKIYVRYTVRLSKDVKGFIKEINLWKE